MIENQYLAADKVTSVLLNLLLELVEIEGHFFEGSFLQFLFDDGVFLPVEGG